MAPLKVIEGGRTVMAKAMARLDAQDAAKPLDVDRWPGAPKGLLAILRDPRIVDFSDESIPGARADQHDGYWIYTEGWTDRSNPGCHTWHEWTVRDLVRAWGGGNDLVRCERGCDCGWDRKE